MARSRSGATFNYNRGRRCVQGVSAIRSNNVQSQLPSGVEIKAEVILKATKVDGIYDADPFLVKEAKMFDRITYMDVLKKGLKVMDSTAISLCKDNNLPIIVFNLMEKGNIKRVVSGESIGTLVSGGRR